MHHPFAGKESRPRKQTGTITHSQPPGPKQNPDAIKFLHNTIGNRAMQRLIASNKQTGITPVNRIQAKLRVGPQDDPHEREADRVADRIMRMTETETQQAANAEPITTGQPHRLKRLCTECKQESQANHQTETTTESTPEVESDLQSIQGRGLALPDSSRNFFESRFGTELPAVRIHHDHRANQLANRFNARAFTLGQDIVFNRGEYSPNTPGGRHLLAHELTHVIQQTRQREATTPLIQMQRRRRRRLGRESSGSPHGAAPCDSSQPTPACQPTPLSRARFLAASGNRTELFGLTTLTESNVEFPEFRFDATTGRVQPTTAELRDISSIYTQAGQFTEGRLESHNSSCEEQNFPVRWHISPAAAAQIAAGEQEHCQDYYCAFEQSLGRFRDAVNRLAARPRRFASRRQAERSLIREVGVAPANWRSYFLCLADKTRLRDDRFHTPRVSYISAPEVRGVDHCRYVYAYVTGLMHLGVPSSRIIRDCPTGGPVRRGTPIHIHGRVALAKDGSEPVIQRQHHGERVVDQAYYNDAVSLLRERSPVIYNYLQRGELGQSVNVRLETSRLPDGRTTTINFILQLFSGGGGTGPATAAAVFRIVPANVTRDVDNTIVEQRLPIHVTHSTSLQTRSSLARDLYHEGLHMLLQIDRVLQRYAGGRHRHGIQQSFEGYLRLATQDPHHPQLMSDLQNYLLTAHGARHLSTRQASAGARWIRNIILEEKFIDTREQHQFPGPRQANHEFAEYYLVYYLSHFGILTSTLDPQVLSMVTALTAILDQLDRVGAVSRTPAYELSIPHSM